MSEQGKKEDNYFDRSPSSSWSFQGSPPPCWQRQPIAPYTPRQNWPTPLGSTIAWPFITR